MSYFHNINVSRNVIFAEGLAVAGFVWNSFRLQSMLCIAILLEAFMTACYVSITYLYRAGTRGCKGYADTPFGEVKGAYGLPSIHDSCRMQTANFALSFTAMQVQYNHL